MAQPIVAVVGRPNVGKSTFFNYIVGERISIVDDTPGVTRDRIYAEAEWRSCKFTLIDTGGIEPYTTDNIMIQMKMQAELAIEMADVILLIVDVKEGLTASDIEVSNMLRKTNKPVVLAANKVDNIGEPPADIYEFYNLGLGEVLPISSSHGLGMGELLDEIYCHFPDAADEYEDDDVIKVAVVGKPNAGKSSLINNILKEERVIVSDIPGTTRDAIDTYTEIDGQKYVFIDTAGLRRKSKVNENIERYSNIRAWAAVDKADVCLIMIDASEGDTEQDTKIAGYVHEAGKGAIFAVNKWDLVDKETGTYEYFRKNILNRFSFMMYAPIEFISAKTGKRVHRLFELIKQVNEQASKRVPTGMLNDVINDAIAMAQPPSDKGKRLKIYYMTQVSVKPPTFLIFVNNAELMHFSYLRYIENSLRRSFGFEGTPIRLITRERQKNDKGLE